MWAFIASWEHQPSKWVGDSGYGVGHFVAEGATVPMSGEIIGWTRNEDGPMAILWLADGTLYEKHISEITVSQIWKEMVR